LSFVIDSHFVLTALILLILTVVTFWGCAGAICLRTIIAGKPKEEERIAARYDGVHPAGRTVLDEMSG
jgi:hypothetical protein